MEWLESATAIPAALAIADNVVEIVLPQGFIWTRGECGQGSFEAKAEGIHLKYDDTNWIYAEVDWSNE